jgi:hypothetical protein
MFKSKPNDEASVTLSPAQEPDTRFQSLNDDAEEAEYSTKSTGRKIGEGIFYTILSLVALYTFMVAVKFIGEGFTLALGCETKGAFSFANNPRSAARPRAPSRSPTTQSLDSWSARSPRRCSTRQVRSRPSSWRSWAPAA